MASQLVKSKLKRNKAKLVRIEGVNFEQKRLIKFQVKWLIK